MEQDIDRPHKLEFEPRLLALFLFIAIPFILVGSLLIMNSARNEVNRMTGDNLAELASTTARYLDSYILMKVTNVSRLTVAPTLLDEVTAANRLYTGDDDAIREQILRIDEDWKHSGGLTYLAVDIVGRRSSEYLRKVAAFSPAYREILLTDQRGALVATTNLTSDYYQADEAWWQKAYGDGVNGAIHVSNVRYDVSARVHGLDVAVPVQFQDGESAWVGGVLKALIDVREVFAVVDAVRVGESGHALLLNAPDKTIINNPNPDEVMKNEQPGFVHLQEALGEGRRYYVSQHQEGSTWLTGFSRMPEPGPSPEIMWYVIVEQSLEEAQAAARAATTYILWFFGAMVLLVLVSSLYMHFRLVRPIREVDLREEMERISKPASETGAV
jgi:hypothetical protein